MVLLWLTCHPPGDTASDLELVGQVSLSVCCDCASFGVLRVLFFFTPLHYLVGCLSMIIWTHAVLGVLYACVLYFCTCTCSPQLSTFHMERRSRNTLIIFYPSLLLSWMFEHDCLDTCCFGCLICMRSVFFVFAPIQRI